MTLFAVTTFVLFHFGLDRESLEGDLAAGVLWVTLLFAAVLGQNRLFVAEQEQGGFDGFLLAPVDRTALFVAKAIALFAFLVVVELVAVPAFGLLLLGPDLLDPLPGLIVVLLLADAGIAVVGTLVAGHRHPHPRARPDRPAADPPAARPGRARGVGGHRATVGRRRRERTPGTLAGDPRHL